MGEMWSHIQRVRNFFSRNVYIDFLLNDWENFPIQVISPNGTEKNIKNHFSGKCRAGAEKKSLLSPLRLAHEILKSATSSA